MLLNTDCQKSLFERVSIWVTEVLPAALLRPSAPLPLVAIWVLVATVPRIVRLRLT